MVCRVGEVLVVVRGSCAASLSLRKTLSPTVQLYMIVPLTGLVVGLVAWCTLYALQLYRVQLQTYGLRFYSSLSCASAYVTVLTLGPDLYFSKFD